VSAALASHRGDERITPAVQDYLKAIYQLRAEEPGSATVSVQRLAERLGVAGPSVTNMVKRLAELGLARHERYHGAELTPAGERIALEVVRHHRLLEQFLVEALGYAWDEVHEEADRLEHHISEEMEARIAATLGYPTADPHGDPIPDPEGRLPYGELPRLLDLEPGSRGTVRRVGDQHPERLRYLDSLGLRPGARVELRAALPFDGPLRIDVDGADHLLGRPLAAAIRVEPDARASEPGGRR